MNEIIEKELSEDVKELSEDVKELDVKSEDVKSEDVKELSEYVIKKILDENIFFLGNDIIVKSFEQENKKVKFEYFNTVKIRGYKGKYKLYFIKKDENLRKFSSDVIRDAGANFETLIGFFFEENRDKNIIEIHVYYIGTKFDLDKLNEMVYSLFSEKNILYQNRKITIKE